MEGYSRELALRLAGVSEGRLRYWERRGLASRGGPYTLAELSELRRLAFLTRQGLRLSALFVEAFRQRWVGCSEGRPIVRDDSGLVELGSGQGILDFSIPAEVHPLKPSTSEPTGATEGDVVSAPDWAQQAVELMKNQQHEQARFCLELALRQQPWSVSLRFNLAVALESLGRLEAAQQELARVLALCPGHADSHFNRARLLELLERQQEAQIHWRCYLSLEPEGQGADQVRRYLGLGQTASVTPFRRLCP